MQKRFFKFIVTIFILFEALSVNVQAGKQQQKKSKQTLPKHKTIQKQKQTNQPQQPNNAQQKKNAKKAKKAAKDARIAQINGNHTQNKTNHYNLDYMKKKKDQEALNDLNKLKLKTNGDYINVASWNMWLYSNGLVTSTDIIKRNRVKLIEVVINRMRPDIFMAQETLNESDDIVKKEIIKQLKELSKKSFDGFCSSSNSNTNQGNCIFWNTDMFFLQKKSTLAPKQGSTIGTAYQHEPAFVKLSGSGLGNNTTNLCLYSFHISFYSGQAGKGTKIESEIKSVLERVEDNNKKEKCDKYIIGGDFNRNQTAITSIANAKSFKQSPIGQYPIAQSTIAIISGTSRSSKSNLGKPANNYDHFIYSSSLSNEIIGGPWVMDNDVLSIEQDAYKQYGYTTKKEDWSSDHFPIFMRLKFK